MPDPTAGEWVVAGVAAGLVVVLAALQLLRPALARSPATPWGRAAGLLLAVAAVGLVLVVAVAVTAGGIADDTPDGPFVAVLVHVDAAGRIAGYVGALLLPLAAVLAVLAVAVVDLGRPSALRIVAGAASGFVLLAGLSVVVGDAGPAATAVGWTAALLGGGAGSLLAVDEVAGWRQSRSSAASDSSTTSSQRSLQSRQR